MRLVNFKTFNVLLYFLYASLNLKADSDVSRPHIILIMSDDQGWGQVGYMGHPNLKGKTPHLDEMSKSGIRFNRFYAAASVCSPTRASVLTGRSPRRTGVPGLHKRLCLQEKTLPQALKQAGYTTAHFGKWHLGGVKGSAMPILPDDPNGPKHYGFDEYLSATNYIEMNPLMTHNGEIVYLKGESSELMVEAGLKFIESNKDIKPTFTVLWYGSPHWPYKVNEKDIEGFPKEMPEMEKNLLGEIIAMDRSIGLLRHRLREWGIAENTMIWFCSDNGGRDHDPHSQAGLRGQKGHLYEGGIRVPGIIEWPAGIQPQTTDFPASTMDIMPTLVDLLNLPSDVMLDVVDGESIAPLFKGHIPERKQSIYFGNKGTALINGDYKLVMNGNSKSSEWELYDLKHDPGESKNIALQYPERLESMKSEAIAIEASILNSELGKDYPEGKVLQPQRGASWDEMEEYQALYGKFAKLKPGWEAPVISSKNKKLEKKFKKKNKNKEKNKATENFLP